MSAYEIITICLGIIAIIVTLFIKIEKRRKVLIAVFILIVTGGVITILFTIFKDISPRHSDQSQSTLNVTQVYFAETNPTINIKVMSTVSEKDYKDGPQICSGYDCPLIFDDIKVYGLDSSENIIWSNKANYIGEGLYDCKISNAHSKLKITREGISCTFNDLNKTDYTAHYFPEKMLDIRWSGESISECKSIINLEYQDRPGFVPLLIDNYNKIATIELIPGDYQVTYNDGSSRIMNFNKSGVYDFSKD